MAGRRKSLRRWSRVRKKLRIIPRGPCLSVRMKCKYERSIRCIRSKRTFLTIRCQKRTLERSCAVLRLPISTIRIDPSISPYWMVWLVFNRWEGSSITSSRRSVEHWKGGWGSTRPTTAPCHSFECRPSRRIRPRWSSRRPGTSASPTSKATRRNSYPSCTTRARSSDGTVRSPAPSACSTRPWRTSLPASSTDRRRPVRHSRRRET
mmetsp:Transcript_18029/g.39279  ORF Transcript_18029/g.39279 Transcript_18029/m.39279 type:complete len:207 (+) Transcript_18029:1106-1726(+)